LPPRAIPGSDPAALIDHAFGALAMAVFFGGIGFVVARRMPDEITRGAYYDGSLQIPTWPIKAGFTTDVYRAARLWLARLPGGVAMASVVGCGGFPAITGSSVACTAAMGRIAIPEMLRSGYSKSLATGSVAIGGTLGSLIPPSILFILYGVFAEQSIARLFMAAVIPGLLSLVAYLAVIYIRVRLRPEAALSALRGDHLVGSVVALSRTCGAPPLQSWPECLLGPQARRAGHAAGGQLAFSADHRGLPADP
jgi:hypothetical protein